MRQRLMTPQEIQRTMDFILRSQADSVIRMDRIEEQRRKWQEKFEARDAVIQREIRSLTREHREFMKSQQKYEKRLRILEERDRRTRKILEERDRRTSIRLTGIQALMRILARLVDIQSNRLDELQKKT